jgi:hypothetical protein
MVAAPSAQAWSQTYVRNANWGPGSSQASFTNSITYNYVSFSNPYGGLPQMGTTLCNSAGTSCYAVALVEHGPDHRRAEHLVRLRRLQSEHRQPLPRLGELLRGG